jgi:PAS domain S-box-containing protein
MAPSTRPMEKTTTELPAITGDHAPYFQSAVLLQHISDAVIATDLNFTVVFFNKAAEQIYAVPASAILGKRLDAFVQYEFHDTTIEKAFDHLNKKGHWQGKASYTSNVGKKIELLANVSYIYDSNGQRTGIVAVNKDITELEKMERKNGEYKLRMKSILNGTTEALFLVDPNYKLLLLNNKGKFFLKKFLNDEPKRGCNFLKVFPSCRREAIITAVTKALEGEDTEYEVYYPNGLWCLVNYTAVLNEYTDKKEICISARDITRRKTAEEELKMLSLLAKDTQNGVMITDAHSIIIWVNQSFEKVYGYSADELIGYAPEKLFAGTDADVNTLQQIHQHVEAGKHFNCELASYNKSGEKLWLRLDMQPIFNEDMKLSKYFVILTDLTQQHLRKEKELRQKIGHQRKVNRIVLKTQEDISNELGRELHDNINQILTAAKLQLEFARTSPELNTDFVEKGQKSVEEALTEIRRLSKQLTAPRFAESELLEEILCLLENLRLDKITKLQVSTFDEKLLRPEIKLHIFRILQEQLKNIVKYAKADTVTIALKNSPTQFCLIIEDDGAGFDTKEKRNGIGLTNIRNRVESYNGKVEIVSSPGNGCKLLIKIPLL